ncbi:hypothetical protein Bbelb_118370 [Branchiostoma belcheri]|nr:hypothetical protein Bbelb_118370 [Branchiostoma belcheri]
MSSEEGVPGSYDPTLTVNVKPSKSSPSRGKTAGETGLRLKLLKLFLSVLLGIVVLACFSLSQLSAISLVKHLRLQNNGNVTCRNFSSTAENVTCRNSSSVDKLAAGSCAVPALMVVYMLLVPYGVSFLRSLWNGAFQDSMPWPHRKAIGLERHTSSTLNLKNPREWKWNKSLGHNPPYVFWKATSATFFSENVWKKWRRHTPLARHSHGFARCKSGVCTPRLAVSGCVHHSTQKHVGRVVTVALRGEGCPSTRGEPTATIPARGVPTWDPPGSPLDPTRDPVAARPDSICRSAPYRTPHKSRRETDRASDGWRTLGVMTQAMPTTCDSSFMQLVSGRTLGFQTCTRKVSSPVHVRDIQGNEPMCAGRVRGVICPDTRPLNPCKRQEMAVQRSRVHYTTSSRFLAGTNQRAADSDYYGKEQILAKPRFVNQTQPIEDGPPNIKMEGNDRQQANKDNITRPTNLGNPQQLQALTL